MRLADHLNRQRHNRFVGRAGELAYVQALLAPDAPPAVVWVHGPGGVGKTSLLREAAHAAWAAGHAAATVDLGLEAATPEAVGTALDAALPPPADRRRLLLVDTVEAAAADDWLRETWLPALPDDVLVVLASRHAPAPAWTSDTGWAGVLQPVALGALSEAESRALLAGHGVDPARHADALAFARGHPLALALAAEAIGRAPDATFAPTPSPDVVGPLVQRFLARAASAPLREAIEACAVVRRATEPLLGALLDGPVSRALFDELTGLPIVEAAGRGLALHALARDAVVADLRWRAPERYEVLLARARRAYTERLHAAATPEAQRDVLADYAYLYRDAPVAGPLLGELQRVMQDGLRLSAARLSDHAAIAALVGRHEGDAAAALAAHWLARQPDGATVVRDAGGAVVGALVRVRLDQTTAADRAPDAVAVAAYRTLATAAPRKGEAALLFRFWGDRERHQGVSAVQALLFAQTVWDYLATPRLAVSLLACAQPHDWAPVLWIAGLTEWGEATAGGVAYGLFGHDWRAEPPGAWLDRLAGGGETPPPPAPDLVVLARDAFDDAVRDALRVVARPGTLLGNPLLDSRLVRDRLVRGGADPDDDRARTDALAALIAEAIGEVAAGRRGDAYAAAVRATYVRPAPSQEAAAERLGLPYSTFRRHLARGVAGVADALWARDEGRGTFQASPDTANAEER